MRDFGYERPNSIEHAVRELARGGAFALAGGTDLIVQMREGLRDVDHVVDLKRISGLVGMVETEGGAMRIGAATPVAVIARDARVQTRYPALASACGMIGSAQIQARASLGGNVCNASPSADAVPPLMCLNAQAEIAGPEGSRACQVEEILTGPGQTSLKKSEIVSAFVVPPPSERSTSAYIRFTPRREMDIAVVGVGAAINLADDGTISGARITLASVGPTALRVHQAEERLSGQTPKAALFEEAAGLARSTASPISDTRGSADYRRSLVGVLTRRALVACCSQLGITLEAA